MAEYKSQPSPEALREAREILISVPGGKYYWEREVVAVALALAAAEARGRSKGIEECSMEGVMLDQHRRRAREILDLRDNDAMEAIAALYDRIASLRWEYCSDLAGSRHALMYVIGERGKDGWELVSIIVVPFDLHQDGLQMPALMAVMKRALAAVPGKPREVWQPIETAPRDGTTIFGYSRKLGQRGMVHFNSNGEWEMVDGLTNMPAGVGFDPTHWHHLAAVPGKDG